mgnify:CR=1 FL=1
MPSEPTGSEDDTNSGDLPDPISGETFPEGDENKSPPYPSQVQKYARYLVRIWPFLRNQTLGLDLKSRAKFCFESRC